MAFAIYITVFITAAAAPIAPCAAREFSLLSRSCKFFASFDHIIGIFHIEFK
ncbi:MULTISPECIES: hypothetical protein [Selenomonas]|uniref:hypothetical protein n=1 Tax=Selenomonas TaxID=970 RepID=UPI00027A6668|nr:MULTISPECIES: hypothetical protein [Selenomonas]EJP28917.1 hypothetical protein HMPREF1147_1255 [Selenomonas sp. FOBRC9]